MPEEWHEAISIEGPLILSAITQNAISQVPRCPAFVHPWLILLPVILNVVFDLLVHGVLNSLFQSNKG